jgi:CBS-domain-containing membrane protein
MSAESTEPGHGNSPAAWVAVIVMLLGFAVGTLGFWFVSMPVIIVGVVLIVLGLIAGYVLKRMGYGVGGARYNTKAH